MADAETDQVLLNTFLASLQLHAPLPPDFQPTLLAVESISQLEDSRIRVITLMATETESPCKTLLPMLKEDEQYRIVFGRELELQAKAR